MSNPLPTIARIAPLAASAPQTLPAPIDAPPLAPLDETECEPDCEARWTSDRQATFLHELAATHNVALAARSVGMSRQSAYRLRARLKGQPFDRAWAMVFGCAFDALAEAAVERAMGGVEVPHFHKGELIGTSRRYDEKFTIALLRMRGELAQVPPVPMFEYAPSGLAEMIERVEHGAEQWIDQSRVPRRRR